MFMKKSELSPNPFFFRRLPDSSKVFISNLLGEWNLIAGEQGLESLVEGIPDSRNIDQLIAQGFINTSIDEAENFERAAEHVLTKKFHTRLGKPSLIMVVPTLRCDHSCAYCQVSRAPIDSKNHELQTEPLDVAKAIHAIAAPGFKLEFQGGEPLLRIDYIRALVGHLREFRGRSFEVVIATALGPNLSESFLDWAQQETVSFSVSFDGIPSLHSKIRKSRIFDSYERTRNQLVRLKEAGVDVGYVATLTKETIGHEPEDFIGECLSLGIDRIYSRPVQPYGFAGQTIANLGCPEDELFDFMERYFDAIIRLNREGVDFFDSGFGVYLENLFRPDHGRHVDLQSPAGYALSACIFNYDGLVYGSDESRMLVEKTKEKSLTLYDPRSSEGLQNLNTHASLLANSFSECSPYCEQCAYQPFCGSDPIHHLYTQGDTLGFKPTSIFCRYTTFMYDLMIRKVADKSLSQNMVLKWLR